MAVSASHEIGFEFVNIGISLGGVDCFRAYGNSENTAEHTHNVAEIEEDVYKRQPSRLLAVGKS